jgi:hypothetical protein
VAIYSFYVRGLNMFDQAAFDAAGYPKGTRQRLRQIANHEATHIALLSDILGSQTIKPCAYTLSVSLSLIAYIHDWCLKLDFSDSPFTDLQGFTQLSADLEAIGVTAYLGAAQYITNPSYITAIGSILSTEGRHQAWVSSAVNYDDPWSGPYDTPLDLSLVYSYVGEVTIQLLAL